MSRIYAGWPSKERIAAELCAQGSATARALGHTKIADWLALGDGRWMTRCWACFLSAVVEPRAYRQPRMRGPILAVRCR